MQPLEWGPLAAVSLYIWLNEGGPQKKTYKIKCLLCFLCSKSLGYLRNLLAFSIETGMPLESYSYKLQV